MSEYRTRRDLADRRSSLIEVAETRLRSMDEGDVEIAVLSATSPGLQALDDTSRSADIARSWNDSLFELTDRFPGRFRAFAALPMHNAELAAHELRRAVEELGFVGGLVNGFDNAGGSPPRYYDDRSYLEFWRMAARLAVPVYLHPRPAPRERATTYSGYPELSGPAWGFHVETAEHVLRMMRGGVFEAAPGIQLILGHLGEILPFMAWRIDHMLSADQDGPASDPGRVGTVTHYLQHNILITTSGFFSTPALLHALSVMGADRIMYSVDYPYESMRDARFWFDRLDLDDGAKERIGHGNARRVLGL